MFGKLKCIGAAVCRRGKVCGLALVAMAFGLYNAVAVGQVVDGEVTIPDGLKPTAVADNLLSELANHFPALITLVIILTVIGVVFRLVKRTGRTAR